MYLNFFKESKKYKRDYFYIILIFFIFNLLVGSKVRTFAIIPDETNALAIPAALSGYRWNLIYNNYYGWGGSIFYFPLFLMIKNPVLLYKSITLLNSILLSLIPCISYYMLKKFFCIEKRQLRFLISIFLGIYPETFSMAQYTWNENWVRLTVWVVLLYVMKLFFKPNKKNSFFLGIFLSYGYSIHGRMLALFPIIIILYLYLLLKYKKKFFDIKFFSLGVVVIFIIDFFIKNQIKLYFWGKNVYLKNTFSDILVQLAEGFKNFKLFFYILRAISSYTFYINLVGFGTLVLGLVLFIKLFKDKKDKNIELKVLGIFSLLGIFFSEIIGAIFFMNYFNGKENYFIYGRYTDHFLPVIIFFSIIIVIKKGLSIEDVYKIIGISLCHTIITLIIESPEIRPDKIMVDVNILPFMSLTSDYILNTPEKFFSITLILFITTVYFIIVMRKNLKFSLLIVILIYSSMNVNLAYQRRRKSTIGYSLLENKYSTLNIISKSLNKNKKQSNLNFITNGEIFPTFYLMLLKDYIINQTDDSIKENIIKNEEKVSLVNNNRETIMLDKNIYRIEINDTKDGTYNLYYKDNNIKKLLDSKNIVSTKYDTYLVPVGKLLTTKDSNVMQNNTVFPKTSMYGPYIELRPNKYQIIIQGNNLNESSELKLTYKKDNQENTETFNYKTILKNNNQYIVEFETKDFIKNFEIVLANGSNNNIIIQKIEIIVK